MKIELILDSWKDDAVIDPTNLGQAALKFTELHQKYYRLYSNEKQIHRMLSSQFKILKLQKFEFYCQGPDIESEAKGWKLPACGKILRSDVPMYLEGDIDLIKLSLKIGSQLEKLELLESILKALTNRGYAIRNQLDWLKFTNGER